MHLHYIQDLGLSIQVSSDAIKTSELRFCVYTFLSPCPSFCLVGPCPSSSLHVAISSDADVWVRPRFAMCMLKAACSRCCYFRWLKWSWLWMTSGPSLRCSVKKTLSGARTWTRARMLGQRTCKCALAASHCTARNKHHTHNQLMWAS